MKKTTRTKNNTTETISIRKVDAAIKSRRTLLEMMERQLPLLQKAVKTARAEIKQLEKYRKTTV